MFDGGKLDEWLMICQSFSLLTFLLNVSPTYEAYNQFVNVLLIKVSCVPHSSKFFPVQVLRYTVCHCW